MTIQSVVGQQVILHLGLPCRANEEGLVEAHYEDLWHNEDLWHYEDL